MSKSILCMAITHAIYFFYVKLLYSLNSASCFSSLLFSCLISDKFNNKY